LARITRPIAPKPRRSIAQIEASHVYQPVMLLELLRSRGTGSVQQIAQALLAHDAAQLEYYQQMTKEWSAGG